MCAPATLSPPGQVGVAHEILIRLTWPQLCMAMFPGRGSAPVTLPQITSRIGASLKMSPIPLAPVVHAKATRRTN